MPTTVNCTVLHSDYYSLNDGLILGTCKSVSVISSMGNFMHVP